MSMLADFEPCLKCNICDTACPVLPEHPEFPGPKRLGPEAARLKLGPLPGIEYCDGCGLCTVACPSEIPVAALIARAKGQRGPTQLRDRLLAHPARLGELATRLAPLVNWSLRLRPARWLMDQVLHLDARRTLPSYSQGSFRMRWRRREHPAHGQRQVAFFVGCFGMYNDPALSEAIVSVLERYGCQVEVPVQMCCGLPALANGDQASARRYAQRNLALLLPLVEQGYHIVSGSPSCGLTLKADYVHVLDLPQGKEFGKHVYDLGEYLKMLSADQPASPVVTSDNLRVAYHTPCHIRLQGIGRPFIDLLNALPGVEVVDLDAGCCGIAGTYGLKKEKYDLAMKMGQPMAQAIGQSGASVVLSDCETCRMQIKEATGLQAMHPVELIQRFAGGTPRFQAMSDPCVKVKAAQRTRAKF
ncbi:MAG: anaerobic glycerol-3-phosphate dehydrogenase subunit C [Deinococcus sp.]|nr:anaerobic glycerol-3-phosphate dehydrogenase subunit C [Deinococcus sp.]